MWPLRSSLEVGVGRQASGVLLLERWTRHSRVCVNKAVVREVVMGSQRRLYDSREQRKLNCIQVKRKTS